MRRNRPIQRNRTCSRWSATLSCSYRSTDFLSHGCSHCDDAWEVYPERVRGRLILSTPSRVGQCDGFGVSWLLALREVGLVSRSDWFPLAGPSKGSVSASLRTPWRVRRPKDWPMFWDAGWLDYHVLFKRQGLYIYVVWKSIDVVFPWSSAKQASISGGFHCGSHTRSRTLYSTILFCFMGNQRKCYLIQYLALGNTVSN